MAVVFAFCLVISCLGQDKSEFQKEFEEWKKVSTSKNTDFQGGFFLMAKAKKTDSNSAIIKIGMSGINSSYSIEVTPLKIEENTEDKFISKKLSESVIMSTRLSPSANSKDFHHPIIETFVEDEVNAIEISVKIGKKEISRITLDLFSNQESIGKFFSVR